MKTKTKQQQITKQQRAVQAFFRLLRKTRDWGWTMNGSYVRTDAATGTCCPILAAARVKFGTAYSGSGNYLEAGRKLGLRYRTADAIATGADSRAQALRRSSAAARYRQQILKALGLKEVAA